MRKIKLVASIGFAGCDDEDIIEVDDDVSDEELQNMADEFSMEHAASWEGDERLGEWDEDSIEMFFENAHGWWEEVEDDA
ncbi:MAG: hypothetical protein CL883_05545 [Dehalococcoidia bacterium]|nr:hypothetical protein [Dehalococcoidia bacterium]